jgi:hypothetical protein
LGNIERRKTKRREGDESKSSKVGKGAERLPLPCLVAVVIRMGKSENGNIKLFVFVSP